MIRLLVTDVEHTLYDAKEKGIFKRNVEAIKKLQEKGVHVVLASGCVLRGVKMVVDFSVCQDDYTLTTGINKYLSYDYYNVGIDLCWVHNIISKVNKPILSLFFYW